MTFNSTSQPFSGHYRQDDLFMLALTNIFTCPNDWPEKAKLQASGNNHKIITLFYTKTISLHTVQLQRQQRSLLPEIHFDLVCKLLKNTSIIITDVS